MFDDILLFVHIVQQQSLAAAALKLKLPAATVTRRLKRLEEKIACQLIHRSARQFVLTQEGENYYQAYAGLVEALERTQLKLSTQMNSLSGPLKVLAPNNISTGLLQPMWSEFIKNYPEITLELNLNNNMQDMLASGADIALRIGPQESSSLYQKRLGSLRTVLVASPSYLTLNGTPDSLEALLDHRLIGTHTLSNWAMSQVNNNKKRILHPRFSAITDDVKLVTQWVCDDIGIALLPSSEVFHLLEQGVLVHLLKTWQGPNRELYSVWPSGKLLNARAKCLRDFMHRHFELNNYDLLAKD
ncbi:MAG: LysR family transcriptional regulator [Oceanospirillaceae bacterium]